MNVLFLSSLLLMFVAYPFSLMGSYGIAFIFFTLSIVAMVGAIFTELGKITKKQISPNLKIVK